MSSRAAAGSSPVTIERLRVGDGQRLRELRLRALRDAPDAFGTTVEEAEARPVESWDRQLGDLPTFVAVADGADVGIVRAAPHDDSADTGYLISMWVAREARRLGIGSILIDAVVEFAKSKAWRRLLLDVGEQNAPAIGLYESKGFVPNGRDGALPPPRDHVREIQMERRL